LTSKSHDEKILYSHRKTSCYEISNVLRTLFKIRQFNRRFYHLLFIDLTFSFLFLYYIFVAFESLAPEISHLIARGASW